jgi:cobalamin synthase
MHGKPVVSNEKIRKIARLSIRSLPLAGLLIGSLLQLTVFGRQLLILALLVWFDVYLIFEVFLNGK